MIRAIVLDFDGVIVRHSEAAKRAAWHTLGSAYGHDFSAAYERAEARFGRGRGGDRFDMLQMIYRELNEPEETISERIASSAEQFDSLVQSHILSEGVHPHDLNALKKLAEQFPLYISSATPASALTASVTTLGLNKYFVEVCGRPATKQEHIQRVVVQERCEPAQILFVGDSPSDQAEAAAAGCSFVGVGQEWQDKGAPVLIDSLGDLPQYIIETNL